MSLELLGSPEKSGSLHIPHARLGTALSESLMVGADSLTRFSRAFREIEGMVVFEVMAERQLDWTVQPSRLLL